MIPESVSKDETAASRVTPQPSQFQDSSKLLDHTATINPFTLDLTKDWHPRKTHAIPRNSPTKDTVTSRVQTPHPGHFNDTKDLFRRPPQSPRLCISARRKRLRIKKNQESQSSRSLYADQGVHSESPSDDEPSVNEHKADRFAHDYYVTPAHLIPFLPYVEKDADGSTSRHDLTHRSFDPVSVVQNWLQSCDGLHHGRCSPQVQTEINGKSGPRFLIDVLDHCLVRTPPAAKYVALSYIWGGSTASACTTNANVASLQEVNGLNHIGDLPHTVADAMDFVRKLDIRYLWCDRLCIEQDGNFETEAELNTMGSIYALSHFTLIAAQGDDAFEHLYVEQPPVDQTKSDAPNDLARVGLQKSNKEILLDQTDLLMDTVWYSRAWTFQEYLFSKRRVVFQSNTVNWECLHAAWHESQIIPKFCPGEHVASSVNESHATGFRISAWPDMARYARLVSIFNQRQLVRISSFRTALLRQGLSFLAQLAHRPPSLALLTSSLDH